MKIWKSDDEEGVIYIRVSHRSVQLWNNFTSVHPISQLTSGKRRCTKWLHIFNINPSPFHKKNTFNSKLLLFWLIWNDRFSTAIWQRLKWYSDNMQAGWYVVCFCQQMFCKSWVMIASSSQINWQWPLLLADLLSKPPCLKKINGILVICFWAVRSRDYHIGKLLKELREELYKVVFITFRTGRKRRFLEVPPVVK